MYTTINTSKDLSAYHHGDIWPEIKQAMLDKYDVVLWVDLLENDNDIDLVKLYNIFLPYSNYVFDPDQRIVVYHRDIDYYINLDCPGFTMYNLYHLLDKLNIPSEFFILISAHRGIEKESKQLADVANVRPMQTIYCPYQWCPPPNLVEFVDVAVEKIEFPFVCLVGLPKSHRMYTLAGLKNFNIFDCGMISLWDNYQPAHSFQDDMSINQSQHLKSIPETLKLRSCTSPGRINDFLILSQSQKQLYHSWHKKISKQQHPKIQGLPNQPESRFQPEFLQYAFWNIVVETVGEYPYPYITEKTIKAILTKRPFVVLGGPNSIKNLHQLGFKTFDRYIDEDYDNYKLYADRSDHAVAQIKKFCSIPTVELQSMCRDMQDILEYNFSHYTETFGSKDLAYFIDNLL